jgi:hypothetical protein
VLYHKGVSGRFMTMCGGHFILAGTEESGRNPKT